MKQAVLTLAAGAVLTSLASSQTCGTCPTPGSCPPTGPAVPEANSDHSCENWGDVNLFAPVLTKIDFSEANLEDSNFFGADSKEADFSYAMMFRFQGQNGLFNKSDFTGADARQSIWWGANLKQTIWRFADLSGALVAGAEIAGADFAGANLSGVNSLDQAVGTADYNCQTIFPEGMDGESLGWTKTGCFPEFYGCGNNPEDSLVVIEGQASLKNKMRFGITNPYGTQSAGSPTFYLIGAQPMGICYPVPWNMKGQGQTADLMVNIIFSTPIIVAGAVWNGPGTLAETEIKVPNDNSLLGVKFYVQGGMIDPSWFPSGVEIGLTPAFALEIGK